MRLGILEFGGEAGLASLVETCRAEDVDVIVAEQVVTTAADAREQGDRLGRADCDGVLITFAANADPYLILPAVLHLGTPLVLLKRTEAGESAFELLATVGIAADRLTDFSDLLPWLKANRKTERQPGIELPGKLYGQRFAVTTEEMSTLNRALWFRQFGIVFVPIGEVADFTPEGDLLQAFTLHFLGLLGDRSPAEGFTHAQIICENGRFICRFGYHAGLPGLPEGIPTMAGDGRVALKTACSLLDIDAIETK